MRLPKKIDGLPIGFYEQDTAKVARDLIGKILVRRIKRRWIGGIIVETEAYLAQGDQASHSFKGLTTGNAAMFRSAGTLYIYPIHTHHCFNIVTETSGRGCAVLIRAIEPIWGIDFMISQRKTHDQRKLTRGPGCLCQALAIDRGDNERHLKKLGTFLIANSQFSTPSITVSKRIGITRNAELPLRFFWDSNWYVSGRAGDHHQKPTRLSRIMMEPANQK